MNLKLVVASMSVLGLISSPVFANHTRSLKGARDFKDMGMSKCVVPPTSIMLVEMSQNAGRSLPDPCRPGWYDRIRISGGLNVDMGKWGNTNSNYMGENYQRLSLNDAYLNIAADVNSWVNAFASLSYMTATTLPNPGIYNNRGVAEYSAAYANNINSILGASSFRNALHIEQGYATVGNFDVTPFFLQVGKSFQDFSRYNIHPITRGLNQVLSETLAESIKLGFIYDGFHGSAYVFDNPVAKGGFLAGDTDFNYGAALGYGVQNHDFGWDFGLGYLYNLVGVNDVAYAIQNFNNASGYANRVGAGNVYADLNYGAFTFAVRYTAALQKFNRMDLPSKGYASLTNSAASVGSGPLTASGTTAAVTAVAPTFAAGATGAKPWALDAKAGYDFDAWGKSQNVFVGYQASHEASGLNIPKYRWLLGYGVEVMRNNTWSLEWDHDGAYSRSNGGTGNNTNLVTIRSTFQFG